MIKWILLGLTLFLLAVWVPEGLDLLEQRKKKQGN